MSAEHTPTPWEAQDFCDGDEGYAIIGSNLGGLVAYTMMQPLDIDNQDTSRAEANAAFIVTAANAYATNQAEIERLRTALADVRNAAESFRDECGDEVAGQVFLRVDAALSGSKDNG